jgi:hypothetical protein|tara:strand:- start:27 stop:725 length:699 start_codon:yes stop_codon:yes gene_type:complete
MALPQGITKEFLEMTYPDEYYKNVIQPAKMGKGPIPSKLQMLSKSQPLKATTMQLQNLFSPGKYDAFRAQGTPLASKVLGGFGKGLGYLAKFLGPASFFFDSKAMGNAELPEGYDADQEYFDYYNKYGDNYGDLKIPGSNWRQKLMNQKIQQQKKMIGMPQHLTHTPPSSPIQQVQQNIQTYGNRDRPNEGMNTPGGGKGQSPTGGDVAGTPFVRGGRASYFDGGLLSLWPR